jgi:hypothetical protein
MITDFKYLILEEYGTLCKRGSFALKKKKQL